MILRSIEESAPAKADTKPRPVWDAVFEHQSRLNGAKEIWMITQPSHSALSGEMAAKLRPDVFGAFDQGTIRAIALHDAGWSKSDSQQIQASRSVGSPLAATRVGYSFLDAAPTEAVAAWTDSVETALKVDTLGGLLVSEHFRSIAQSQVSENPGKAKEMAAFARQEEARQGKLRPKIGLDPAAIERMVDGLRFTDLVSLYLCAGLTEAVVLPQKFQQQSFTLTAVGDGTMRLEPFPFQRDTDFSFAALRHPRTKLVSSASFSCKVTG